MQRGRRHQRKIIERAFSAVIDEFLQSDQFRKYAQETQACWGRELRLAAREDTLGSVSVLDIRPALVQGFINGLSDRPGKQAAALSALKVVEKWALGLDYLTGVIAYGVSFKRSRGGHKPWTDEQIRLAEANARPELARAITLAVNTGQRGSDLVRLCWTDIEIYQGRPGFVLTQKKTGREMWVPIPRELDAAMAAWERAPGPILRRPTGRPWTRKALTWAWICERDGNSLLGSLAGLTLHGLRSTACVRLRQAGSSIPHIADMVGLSEPMVARYCRLSEQRDNATAAVVFLDRNRENKSERKTQIGGS
jgi:integrase